MVAVLLAVSVVSTVIYDLEDVETRPFDALCLLLAVVTTAPLAVRRRFPVTSGLAIGAGMLLYLVWNYASVGPLLVVLVAIYSAGAYANLAGALVVLVAQIAVTATHLIVEFDDLGLSAATTYNLGFSVLGYVGVLAIGRSMHRQRRYASALELRADRLEQDRAAEVRAALAEERARIARELHDVVAHHVSVMTVQAAGAQRSLPRNPQLTAEALRSIETTGRSALAEMRRILDIFRGSGLPRNLPEWITMRGPQPGVADLEDLIEQVQGAGVRVTLTVDDDVRDVPAGVELTVFRIVQEALTNTLKHAGPSTAEVRLSRTSDALLVAVTDDGRGLAAALDGRRPGHGLLGMRERVTLYGGTLAVGPKPGGGYEVRARIPFDHSERPAV